MQALVRLYSRFSAYASYLQSPFLLGVRLYFGWQLMTNGWGKLHNIAGITTFFASLNIPFPSVNAHFISGLEFFGGILLMLGLGSRLVALLMTCNMLVAYWTADHEAFLSFFSDSDKFTAAAPFTILFASLIILAFGPGLFSLDALIARRLAGRTA
jgi:putative oxidoreductase